MTTLCLWEDVYAKDSPILLVSGSWDKTVRIWNIQTKALVSSTLAHADFVKCVFAIPELKLLATTGSDKLVRFWDMSEPTKPSSLTSIGSLSSHSRPVQCLSVDVRSPTAATLYTADSMGVIIAWDLERDYENKRCRGTQIGLLNAHRTGINCMMYGRGQLWTASSDDSVALQYHPPPPDAASSKAPPLLKHPSAAKALLPLSLPALTLPEDLADAIDAYLITAYGDTIRVYDVSAPHEPELLREVADGHWHDVVGLALWVRSVHVELPDQKTRTRVEPWIVSASLDGTIQRWKFADLLNPPSKASKPPAPTIETPPQESLMTEEEERELAELMDE